MIHQVQSCVDELTEGLGVANAVDGEVEITWIFNGFGLEVIVSQEGKRFLLEEKNPSAEELLAEEKTTAELPAVLSRECLCRFP